YASLVRTNQQLIKAVSPSNRIVARWSWDSHQRLANLPLVRLGEDAHRKPVLLTCDRKNVTILIVGESSRGDDVSLG
ncbi:phosphoethanolamine transferase EptA, partial [Salmonella enterica]